MAAPASGALERAAGLVRAGVRARGVGTAVVLVACVLGALALDLRAIGAPLWIDEGIATGIAAHPLGALPELLRQDGSPPLYYVLLHGWIALFGTGEAAGHALSVLFAVACAPAAWWAVRTVVPAPIAQLAALASVFNPFLSVFADETRMYSLLYLLALLAVGALVRAFVERRRGWTVGFGLLLAAVLYTHNWGAFFALGAALAVVLMAATGPRGDRLATLVDGALGFALAGALYAPWVPSLLFQAQHTGAPWSHVLGPAGLLASLDPSDVGRAALVAFTTGAAVAGARRSPRIERRTVVALTLLGLGALVSGWAYSLLIAPVWAARYLAVVLAPLLVAYPLGLARARWLGAAGLALLAAAYGVWTPSAGQLEHKSNAASVAAALGARVPAGSLVVSTAPERVPTLDYYLPAGMHYLTTMGPVGDPTVVDWRDAVARIRRAGGTGTFLAAVRALPAGTRVLLARPWHMHANAPYTRLVAARSRAWARAAAGDPQLRELTTLRPRHHARRATLQATLYVKR